MIQRHCYRSLLQNLSRMLGVWIQDNFKVDIYVDYILSLCNQIIFLMKRLRDQGLSATYMYTVCSSSMGMFLV